MNLKKQLKKIKKTIEGNKKLIEENKKTIEENKKNLNEKLKLSEELKKLQEEIKKSQEEVKKLKEENKKIKEDIIKTEPKKVEEIKKDTIKISPIKNTIISKGNSKTIHKNIRCDICSTKDIEGIRYSCNVCEDYDLCESCANKKEHNKFHHFTLYDEDQSVVRDTVHSTIQCNECYTKKIYWKSFSMYCLF